MTDLAVERHDDSDHTDIAGLARRGLMSLGGAAVSAVVNLLIIVVVTRGVGKETAGFFFSATSVFVVLQALCALGAATGVVYFIARLRALGRDGLVRRMLATALGPVVVVSITVGVALLALAPRLTGLVGAEQGDALATGFLRLLAVFLPLAVVYDILIAATQGFHTMAPTVILERLTRPLTQIALLLVVIASGATWLLPVAWAGPYVLTVGLAILAVRKLVRATATSAHGRPAAADLSARRFWSYTGPRGLAAVAQLSLQRLDIVLVAALLGPAEAAIYTAATRFVVLGQLGSQAVALAVQPKFSELMARNDLTATQRVYTTSTAWVIAVTWPIHLLVAVLSPMLLRVFGSGYEDGRWVAVTLALAMLVATGCGMVTMLLVMAGRTAANLLNVVVALVSNLALNVVLIPMWGIEGAAVSWAVAIVLSNLLPLFQIHRAYRLSPFAKPSAAVAVLAALTLGVLPTLGWLVYDSLVLVLVLAAAGCVLYAGGLWRLRTTLDLDSLAGAVGRKLGRRSG